MTRIVSTLAEIGGAYEALFCDIWGCYHDGIRPFPAAVAALQAFRRAGGAVILLTNAPRPAASVERMLEGMGAPKDSYDGIMSSGTACQRAVASGEHGTRFHYVGPDRDLHMLTDVGLADTPLAEADAILCTGLRDDRTETPADYYDEMAGWLEHGLPMLCANPDLVVDRGAERLYCAGAIALAYEQAGGRVVWFGKPHAPIYDASVALLAEITGRAIPRERILALGDGIRTDVAGGLAYGLDVMFVTGGLAAETLGTDPEHPDPDRLDAYLAEHKVAPPYAIGRLR